MKKLMSTGFKTNLLSRYKKELMGLAAVLIMFMHGATFLNGFGNKGIHLFESILSQVGGAGVDIFLFLAGLGSVYSFKRNGVGGGTSVFEKTVC